MIRTPKFRRRRVVIGLSIAGAIFVGVGVLPTRGWFAQRSEMAAAEAQLSTLTGSNERLQRRIDRMGDDVTIERQARELYGFVYPYEESYTVPPPAAARVDLPDSWPFTQLEESLRRAAVRRAAPSNDLKS